MCATYILNLDSHIKITEFNFNYTLDPVYIMYSSQYDSTMKTLPVHEVLVSLCAKPL